MGLFLLSEAELDDLVEVAGGLPGIAVHQSLKTPERQWLSCDEFFLNTPLCTGEIRSSLGPSEAERWAKRCNGFVARLTTDSLLLAEGIELARQLTQLIRQYLIAMGEKDLVPHPHGTFPTPTNPAPMPVNAEDVSDPRMRNAVRRMRVAIEQHDRGSEATPAALIKIARINKQVGRKALRILQDLGEYHGHGRSKAD